MVSSVLFFTGNIYCLLSICERVTTLTSLFPVNSSIADKSKNRGFAFVEYETHRAAAVARRKCMPGRLQLWGKTVAVDWAEPEPIVEEEILSRVLTFIIIVLYIF